MGSRIVVVLMMMMIMMMIPNPDARNKDLFLKSISAISSYRVRISTSLDHDRLSPGEASATPSATPERSCSRWAELWAPLEGGKRLTK